MKKIVIVVLLITAFHFAIIAQENVNGVILSETDNLTVVQVWGNHYERGYAQGYLLAGDMYDLLTNYLIPEFGSYMSYAKEVVAAGQHIAIDDKYITEAEGVIAGAADAGMDTTGIDYRDILVANSFLDLQGFSGFKHLDFGTACSALMSWGDATINTPLSGESVISRHLDWTVNSSITDNQVMVAHIPSEPDEQNWVMIGFAGQIGALSGVNTNGLAAFQNMMSDFSGQQAQINQGYQPVWFTLRDALEIADYNSDGQHNTNDLRAAIESNAQGYADGYLISCLTSAVLGVDSLTALVSAITPTDPKIVNRTNAYDDNIPGDNLYVANSQIKRNDAHNYCYRYNAVAGAMGTGENISAEQNWSIMRDNSGVSGNIQFMQFVPEHRYINISAYRDGAAAYTHDSTRYYLDDLFDVAAVHGSDYHHGFCRIVPNPFTVNGYVKFSGKPGEVFEWKVYDATGHLSQSENNVKTNLINLSGSSMQAGMYCLILTGNKGTIHSTNFIVAE
ncbi:MAG: T9SS type A sorting domain-containing protein [Bacteroidota bacterium]|nr:T9SS type A sorting domain-containing protein [Bacteroidota bacterium]